MNSMIKFILKAMSDLIIVLFSILANSAKLLILLLAAAELIVLPTPLAYAQGPVVQGINPLSNTVTAPLTSTVSITYSQSMSASTVTTQTFAIHAMQTGLLSQTYGVNGGTISLTPTNSFKPGELVQVSATTGTLNITGTAPLSPTVWQFWTKAGVGPAIFNELTSTFGGGDSRGVALGDVDGDGDLDAVVANISNQAQDVHLNDGSGAFSPSADSTFGGGNSIVVALGDVDGDGDLDAVVANWIAAQAVHLNDGSGSFSPSADTTFGSGSGSSSAVVLGDVDGDGDLDAVVANYSGAAQDVHLNDGRGVFSPSADTTFGGGNSRDVVLGDVDGDGDLDAVVANWGVAKNVHLNDGSGAFSPSADSTFGGGWSYGMALGDVDGDGDLDAVVANLGAAQAVHLNDGRGVFSPSADTTFGSGSSYGMALGDVDGDGDLDAVVANDGAAQDVHLNDSSGVFSSSADTTFGGGSSRDVALGDVDGDGDLDAVVANLGTALDVALNEVLPDLSLVKNVSPATVAAGGTLTYTLTFSNAGNGAASGVVITDYLPISVSVSSVISSGDVVITRTFSSQTAEVFETSAVSAGQGGIITITAQITDSIYITSTINNSVEITTTSVDSDTSNNTSNVDVTVSPIGNCYATPDDGATVYRSSTALAVRLAVADAAADGTVKVAGYCAGVNDDASAKEVVGLDKNLTIIGAFTATDWSTAQPGTYVTTLDAVQGGRVITINGSIKVKLENLTLTGGQISDGGAGIYNPSGGSVILSNTLVSSNTATNGGGIYNTTGGRLDMINSTVSSNTSSVDAGGIMNNSSVVMTNSTVSYNKSSANGGGIYNTTGGSLVMTNSVVSTNTALSYGGGIYNQNNGQLAITRTTISTNTAFWGGGIYNADTTTASISQTVIKDNKATGTQGGGIWNEGLLSLSSSAVSSNTVVSSPVGKGGGIYNKDAGVLAITGTTIAYNSVPDQGGGIYNDSPSLTLLNSTFSSNSSGDGAGALYSINFFTGAKLTNVTVVSNTVSNDAAGLFSQHGNLQLKNSLVALNTGGGSQNCNNDITSLGYNIDGNDDCGLNAVGDQKNVNPQVGPLQDNGGPTIGAGSGEALLTHALLSSSPALGKGVCVAGLTTDQRGEVRPNPAATPCDIGAYESSFIADLSISKSVNPSTANAGETITYTLTFSNVGSGLATEVVITDNIPLSLTHSSLSFTSTEAIITPTGSISYTWNVEDLSAGESGIITISGIISSNLAAGSVSNTAKITTTAVESDTDNNTNQANLSVTLQADLDISKSASPNPAIAGQAVTYTVVMTNNGPSDSGNWTITDTVPSSTTYSSNSGGCSGSGPLVCSGSGLAASGFVSYTIVLTVDDSATGNLTNVLTVSGSVTDTVSSNNVYTDVTPITTQADLTVSKVDELDPVVAGETLTYTIRVTNSGPSDAQNVVVTDSLPSGVTFGTTSACTEDPSGVPTCTLGGIAAGSAKQYVVTVTVDSGTTGSVTNNITVTADNAINPGDDTASETTTINTKADLVISKSDDPDAVIAGNLLTYTVRITNIGPSDALNVVVTDTLPAGVTFGWTPGAICAEGMAGYPVCTLSTIAGGATVSYQIVVTVSASSSGNITNVATATTSTTDPDNNNNVISQTTAIKAEADLEIIKTSWPEPVVAGEQLTYTLTISNNGPSDIAIPVTITDTLGGVTFDNASGSCGHNAGTVTCTIASLTANNSVTRTIVVTVNSNALGTITNTATVSNSNLIDLDLSNNSITQTSTVNTKADLVIAKSDFPDPVAAGATLTYTVIVTNNGPSDAQSVLVTDTLPARVTFGSTSGCSEDPNGVSTCTLDTITAGSFKQYVITVTVIPTATGSVDNVVTVTASTTDPGPGANSDTESTTVNVVVDLEINKVVDDSSVDPGQRITYTVSFSNNGPSTATGVVITDQVPISLSNISTSNSGVNIVPTGSFSYVWNVDDLDPGDGGTITIGGDVTTTLSGAASFTNTAEITGSNSDSNINNNSSSVKVSVPEAQVEIGKFVNNANPGPGETITYTIIITNNGPNTATGLVVSDTLPVSVTLQSPVISTSGSYDQNSGVWSGLSDLAMGNWHILTLTVVVTDVSGTLGNSIVNTAVITEINEIDNTNNSASVTITVKGADLQIGKTVDNSTPSAGGTIVYTVVVTNTGSDATTGVVISDTLPLSVTFVSSYTTQGGYDNSSGVWTLGAINGGDSTATLRITSTLDANTAGQTITNVAVITTSALADLNSSNNVATATLTVKIADLSMIKSVSPTSAREGQTIVYTLVVTNVGPDSTSNIIISDTLPLSVTYISQGGTGTYNSISGAWNVGTTLNSSDRATMTITATVNAGTASQSITNTAVISSAADGDTNSSNNLARASFSVQEADLDLAKFITGPGDGSQLLKLSSADTGQRITYTLVITNNGPYTLPTGSVVSDTLPSSLTILAPSTMSGTITNTGNLVTWTLPQLLINEFSTATITATVNAGNASQTITNTASINSATQGDTITANNSSAATLTINGADLQIGKSVTPISPLEGDTITYTIVVTNIAGDTSPNIVISDVLPTGLTYGGLVSGSPSEGSYAAGSVGVWSSITLTLNSSATLIFTATVDGGTGGSTLVNSTAISSSDTEDPDTSNNTASASVTVATFDLAISKSSVRDGAAITYTLSVSNSGSTTAPGAVISDAVPSGMVGNTWNWSCVASNGATCPNATGSDDINETSGSIPVNGRLDYTITGTLVISTATMTNTATVTSLNGLGDSDASNNSVTDISSVASGGIYLPIICKAGCLNLTVIGSDLIIVPGSLIASSSAITLQIQNAGNTATSGDFWVDVYFNPSETPSLNKTWQSIASYGAAWEVTQSLAAGEVVTLTIGGTYYDASKSSSSFPSGANVYGYVDSVNYATTYGAVQESNKSNNLSGPVTSTAGGAMPIVVDGGSVSSGSLPKR